MADDSSKEAFARLTPDHMLDAIESVGLQCDGRFLALNSYEWHPRGRRAQIGLCSAGGSPAQV